ncbi:MAG: glutamate synthase-related protein [Alphaproteobacteria bacterium]|nr:glutamate synthase-related protein [Alphaproteobacteria bacterium]
MARSGIGTTSLVAMGCIMVRQCHSNTCPVGVCTQDERLRAKFTGTPEKVVNLFTFIAEEVRETLAEPGFSSMAEYVSETASTYALRILDNWDLECGHFWQIVPTDIELA